RGLRNDRSVGRQRRPWRHTRHQRRDINLGKHDAMPEVDRCWSHAKRTAFAPLPSHRAQRGGDDVTVPFRTEQRLFLVDAVVLIALLLIIVPNYVNLVAISLASPLTVRVVLAIGPSLIFFCQLIEGRLTVSRYSLMAAILYGLAAIAAAMARQHAIRAVETRVVT